MGKFRIQPQDIEVPEGEPLKHDLLEREEAVETLTQLIDSTLGPCVLQWMHPGGMARQRFLKSGRNIFVLRVFPS